MRLATLLLALVLPRAAAHAPGEDGPTLPLDAPGPPKGGEEAPKTDWDVSAAHGPVKDVSFTVKEGTWLNVDVSPDGTKLLFDLLGDLWVMPITGGPATALTHGVSWETDGRWSADGRRILYTSDASGNEELWAMGADGSGAARVTREDTDRWTDPVWAPEPGWILARRRSVDTRSIGVHELWLLHEQGGDGVRLTKLEEDPHAGEAAFSPDGRTIYFSTRAGRFEYNHNPNAGLWQIVRFDRELGERVPLTDLAASAARPTPSPDGRWLAFLTRDRARPVLARMELTTGRVYTIPAELDPDQLEGFELRGTYPRMDWTPDGKALIYWARGGFWRVDVDSGVSTAIPFSAEVKTRLTDAVRPERRVDEGAVHARVLRWPVQAKDGTVYVAGVGRIWALPPGGSAVALSPEGYAAYFPALSPDQSQLTWVSWDDVEQGQVWVGPRSGKGAPRPVTLTGADYQAPAISPDGRRLLFLRGSGATARGQDLGAESSMELRVLDLVDTKGKAAPRGDGVRLRTIPFRGSGNPSTRPQWSPDGQRIWWIEDEAPAGRVPETTVLVSCQPDGTDKKVHVRFDGAQEVRLSPDFRWMMVRRGYQASVAAVPALGSTTMDWKALPSRLLTEEAGDWVDWVDGDTVSWSHGDQLWTLDVPGLLDREAKEPPKASARTMTVEVPRATGVGTVVFTNARILPMDAPPIPKGTVVVQGRRIVAVGADVPVPTGPGVKVHDLGGKTLLPGLVDVHAHLHYASGDVLPEQEWRHLVNLAYGVTTVFDPSASTDLVFGQAELVEAGRMAGPRVYSTGYILYGALDNLSAKLKTPEDAVRQVKRLQDMGAIGVKSYQQSHRSHRQWIVEACRKLGMLDVPEGGGDLLQNLTMIVDGHSSVEHALPVAPMYDDVMQLWSRSRTTYVPTLLVAYGGLFGEVEYWQSEKVWEDARLGAFTPPWVLMARGYRPGPFIMDPAEFRHHLTAATAAKLSRAGVSVALGAHGQLQGLGPHWELEALGGPGAMTPEEALRAATLVSATHLGLGRDLGSVTPGKIADLFVVDGDPLRALTEARNVVYVMKDGVLWDAATMNTLSPTANPRPPMIWEAAVRPAMPTIPSDPR